MVTRWKHEITVAIARRRAAMTRAVLPQQAEQLQWILGGRPREGEAESAPGRLLTVEDDEELPEVEVDSDDDSTSIDSDASFATIEEDDDADV